MKIKYLKDAPNGAAGTTDDVTDFEGNILIKTGHAEAYVESKPKRKSKPKDDNGADNDDGIKTDTDKE